LILLDTSGLFAALVRNQRAHERALAALEAATPPFVLSPFVLAELDYFLGREAGADEELAFLDEVAADAYELAAFDAVDVRDARAVIHQYRDLRIGLTDASLVVLAGRYRTNRILTLDERHFRAVQTPAGEPFVVLPADA
jgi:predicted nucleic acid-binding protein